MKTAEQKRKDRCYGRLCCWNFIQAQCPVYEECFVLAGGVRMVDKVKAQNRKLKLMMLIEEENKC